MKLGLCEKCGKPVNAAYEIRNNNVYLAKFCQECGRSATLVTRDARKWRWKREITHYQEPAETPCDLDCSSCDHQYVKPPTTVSIDVTNLCNQRCPICLAYVDAMGYAYHPPVEYFDKIFKHFKHQDPKPNICFFGGEPTVHEDFLTIVKLAKSYGFQVQLFTNGLKLADRAFCKELSDIGVQVNFGFDGTRPEIYHTLRGDNSLAVKRKAFDNVIEFGVNKLAVITTVAKGVNDSNLDEMMRFIHDYKDHVSVWAFVPLTPCWHSDDVKLEPTTTECVESMFERNDDGIEFVPTGMMNFRALSRFFGRQTLGGSHPNCESATLLVSDGERYHPISRYLNMPLSSLLASLRQVDDYLADLPSFSAQGGIRRSLFEARAVLGMLRVMRKGLNLKSVFGARPISNGLAAIVDILKGRKIDEILSKRTAFKTILTLLTIPYEDLGGLDNARLKDCPAVFAYEDVETGRIKTTAFCSWQTVKDEVCRNIQAHYDSLTAVTRPAEAEPKAAMERK